MKLVLLSAFMLDHFLASKLKATTIMHTTSKHDPDIIVGVCTLILKKEICLLPALKKY